MLLYFGRGNGLHVRCKGRQIKVLWGFGVVGINVDGAVVNLCHDRRKLQRKSNALVKDNVVSSGEGRGGPGCRSACAVAPGEEKSGSGRDTAMQILALYFADVNKESRMSSSL